MTLLNSIFVCNSIRELRSEIKSIYQLIDIRCEICNNKQQAVQLAIDLKFELLTSKIDNLVLLINQLRG